MATLTVPTACYGAKQNVHWLIGETPKNGRQQATRALTRHTLACEHHS